jgi:hypothetical protein
LPINRLIDPLFDTPGFVGHLEAAYQKSVVPIYSGSGSSTI